MSSSDVSADRRAGRASSRDKILGAAAALVAEHGVQQLTIEAAAAAAGITKAGLIYHFKTRDELLAALVEHILLQLDVPTRRQARAGAPAASRPARLTEQADMTFGMPAQQKRLLANMLAAASAHRHLLPPVRALFARSYAEVGLGPQGGLALVAAAAMDGMLLLDLLQLHEFTAAQRKAMRRALLELIRRLT